MKRDGSSSIEIRKFVEIEEDTRQFEPIEAFDKTLAGLEFGWAGFSLQRQFKGGFDAFAWVRSGGFDAGGEMASRFDRFWTIQE